MFLEGSECTLVLLNALTFNPCIIKLWYVLLLCYLIFINLMIVLQLSAVVTIVYQFFKYILYTGDKNWILSTDFRFSKHIKELLEELLPDWNYHRWTWKIDTVSSYVSFKKWHGCIMVVDFYQIFVWDLPIDNSWMCPCWPLCLGVLYFYVKSNLNV